MTKENITHLPRRGLYEWIIQRVTSILIGGYFLFIVAFILCHANMEYTTWHSLFQKLPMRIFTSLAILSIIGHAWVGLWTITTDYLNEYHLGSKAIYFRLPVQIFFVLLLSVYCFWGMYITWSL